MSDNDKVQKLIDANVALPKGTYSIDATKPIILRDNKKVDWSGVTFVAIPNSETGYAVIQIEGNNIFVKGGTIIGERKQHKGTTGEWGMGLKVKKGANIVLDGITCRECWGDGFYFGGDGPQNVLMENCKAIENRRQGLSIIGGKNLTIRNSVFSNTSGTLPSDGLDIEPDRDKVVDGVLITGCKFANNAGAHIEIASKRGVVKNVTIKSNTFDGKSEPLKIQGREPSLWMKAMALFGNYSAYPTEVKI